MKSKDILGQDVIITDADDDFYNQVGTIVGTETIEKVVLYQVTFGNTQERYYSHEDFKFKNPEEVGL